MAVCGLMLYVFKNTVRYTILSLPKLIDTNNIFDRFSEIRTVCIRAYLLIFREKLFRYFFNIPKQCLTLSCQILCSFGIVTNQYKNLDICPLQRNKYLIRIELKLINLIYAHLNLHSISSKVYMPFLRYFMRLGKPDFVSMLDWSNIIYCFWKIWTKRESVAGIRCTKIYGHHNNVIFSRHCCKGTLNLNYFVLSLSVLSAFRDKMFQIIT